METDSYISGRDELQKIQEAAWGLLHGSAKPSFLSNGNSTEFEFTHSIIAYGFKNAADEIAATALEIWPKSKYLWYPLCYCYRHFIELTIKEIAIDFLNIEYKRQHELVNIWEECRNNIAELFGLEEEEYENACSHISNIVIYIDDNDPKSTRFRYPDDHLGVVDINIHELVYFAEVFDVAAQSLKEAIERLRQCQ